jgi:tRNA U34 5-carboxymethylaminomethyl modifying GTPase MnmE/TrmE
MTSNTRSNRDIYVTELSLYNSSVYYPWELCPEDIDKQMNTKLDNSRLSVFNTLMDNGNFKAIYESENQYYIRSEYITPEVATASAVQELQKTITNMQNTITQSQNAITQLQNANTQLQNANTQLQNTITQLQTKHTNEINAINLELTNIKNRLTALENPTQEPDIPEFPNL